MLLPDLKKFQERKQQLKKLSKYNKYKNLAKKKLQKIQNDLAHAEAIDYNHDTNISQLNKPPLQKNFKRVNSCKKNCKEIQKSIKAPTLILLRQPQQIIITIQI